MTNEDLRRVATITIKVLGPLPPKDKTTKADMRAFDVPQEEQVITTLADLETVLSTAARRAVEAGGFKAEIKVHDIWHGERVVGGDV